LEKSSSIVNHEPLLLAIVYLNPNTDRIANIENLEETLINRTEGIENVIVGGDFNVRIGNLNSLEQEIVEGTVIEGGRQPKDLKINLEGRKIVEIMEKLGLIVLNGRSYGDIPGEYTFVNNNGASTVDYVWINLDLAQKIKRFEINDEVLCSDHLPLVVQLEVENYMETTTNLEEEEFIENCYRWDETQATTFKNSLKKNNEDRSSANIYEELRKDIDDTARKLHMVTEKKISNTTIVKKFKKPWYNNRCKTGKYEMRKEYRKWKRGQQDIKLYLEKRKQYKEILKEEERKYDSGLQEQLKNIKNSKQFWQLIRQFRERKTSSRNIIAIHTWNEYLMEIYDQTIERCNMEIFVDVRHAYLDKPITMDELCKTIRNTKNRKTPGPDGILNEQIKNLNHFWLNKLLVLYNNIIETQQIPRGFASSNITMIYKKGNREDPENYRSISLLNNIFKLLTQIIAARIYEWCESVGILNEGQMGFRKGRGCLDGIFSLASIAALKVDSNWKKMYAIFVDFKKAFSSVSQSKLWDKLFRIGVSGRLIKTLQALYQETRTRIKSRGEYTKEVKATVGVLEGDPMSALAFIMYISDMEIEFRNAKLRGIDVDHKTDIIMLMYADDLVILADSKVDLTRKIQALYNYCEKNELTVNVQKTKVMIFKKSGKNRISDVFSYDEEKLEVVHKYNYLGIPFSSSALFHLASKQAVQKGNLASSSVLNTLARAKVENWDVRLKLFHTIAKNTILYAAESWGLRYTEDIERGQLGFFKRLLKLPRSTPGYIVRQEIGLVKIAYWVLKQVLIWWAKLLKMDGHRYPKVCYEALLKKDKSGCDKKYNWATQLKEILIELDFKYIWEAQNHQLLQESTDNILIAYSKMLTDQDERRIALSSYNTLYKSLKLEKGIEKYLQFNVAIFKQRIAAQIRGSGKNIYLNINSTIHSWDTQEICSVCNKHEPEDWEHFLKHCPVYNIVRNVYLMPYFQGEEDDIINLLQITNEEKLNNLCFYIVGALQLRSIARGE
jgi:hypothetical protein